MPDSFASSVLRDINNFICSITRGNSGNCGFPSWCSVLMVLSPCEMLRNAAKYSEMCRLLGLGNL